MKRLSEQEVEQAITLYLDEGLSYQKVGDQLGVSGAAIRGLLQRRGIQSRSLSESHRTKQCNHSYFGQPIDEDRAYWIGFLLADGCVTEKSYGHTRRVTCRLAPCDIGHLEKLRNALNSDHAITDVGEQGVQFSVSSEEMVNDLACYNVLPRKSAAHQFSEAIPEEFLPHYFRGYFDGNGGIARHKSSKWTINCAASESFLLHFRQWIQDRIGGNPAGIKFSHGIHRIAWAGTHRCREILDLMYQGSSVYLDRKKEKYDQVVRDAESSPRGPYNRK